MAKMHRRLLVLVLLGSVGACAKSVPVTGSAQDVAGRTQARWSASLRPLTMSSTAVLVGASSGSGTAASYGSATLSPSYEQIGRVRYDISVTMPTAAGAVVAWALFTGACNTPSPPVVPTAELQPIEVGTSGSGVVRGTFTAQLERGTTYNLRVYSTGRATDVNNVALCAKLDYSGPK